jgi:hypothetical protein
MYGLANMCDERKGSRTFVGRFGFKIQDESGAWCKVWIPCGWNSMDIGSSYLVLEALKQFVRE